MKVQTLIGGVFIVLFALTFSGCGVVADEEGAQEDVGTEDAQEVQDLEEPTIEDLEDKSLDGGKKKGGQQGFEPSSTSKEEQGDASWSVESGDCADFITALNTCSEFSCTFEHPMTGDELEKRVLGYDEDLCVYEEEMPNNMMMTCNYPNSHLGAVAKYYEDLEEAESAGTSLTDEGALYFINGEQVENPLQDAMDQGFCLISM
jgi:hypothetical protein